MLTGYSGEVRGFLHMHILTKLLQHGSTRGIEESKPLSPALRVRDDTAGKRLKLGIASLTAQAPNKLLDWLGLLDYSTSKVNMSVDCIRYSKKRGESCVNPSQYAMQSRLKNIHLQVPTLYFFIPDFSENSLPEVLQGWAEADIR